MNGKRPIIEEEKEPYLDLPQDQELLAFMREDGIVDYGALPPDHFPFDSYTAYKARLIAFINGALYALMHDEHLNRDDRNNKIKAIQDFAQEKICDLEQFRKATQGQAVSFGTELYRFYRELAKISGLSPKELTLAESFYVWQKIERPKRTTRFSRKLSEQRSLIIEQSDTPQASHLTSNQKEELLKIRNKDKLLQPHWFKKLPAWAQKALLDLVPETKDGDWSKYERCRPSILRQIPGEANAMTHELKISCSDTTLSEDQLLYYKALYQSSARRQGAPSSFNMKDKEEREQSAKENLRQMLDEGLPLLETSFNQIWGLDERSKIRLPVLLGGLVTPSEQAQWRAKLLDAIGASGDENNTRLAREKELAITAYVKPNKVTKGHQFKHPHYLMDTKDDSSYLLFNLNVAINALSQPVPADQDFIRFATTFYQQLQKHIDIQVKDLHKEDSDESKGVIQARVDRLKLIKQTIDRLIHLPPPQEGRNRNLYLAALYDLSTRLMGGLSTGNCKSSKDRKGLELMMADAMMIYCMETGKVPSFDAQGEERERLVEIFCQLYASGHQLLLAHDNSPGSPGIKDEGILDRDIVEKLQSMQSKSKVTEEGNDQSAQASNSKKPDKKDLRGLYAQSKHFGNLNKPGTFWKKFRKRFWRYALIGGIITLGIVGIILTATGVLSPLGIIGSAAAVKLGFMTGIVGTTANLAAGASGVVVTVTAACLIRDCVESYRDSQDTFEAQIKRAQKIKAISASPSSTSPETQEQRQTSTRRVYELIGAPHPENSNSSSPKAEHPENNAPSTPNTSSFFNRSNSMSRVESTAQTPTSEKKLLSTEEQAVKPNTNTQNNSH